MRFLTDLPRQALMASVRGYRLFVSPGRPASCRFEPTCSAYALEALARHGAAGGSVLAAHRLLRCGPWCCGGLDPVPSAPFRLFRRGLVADAASPPVPTLPPSP